MEKYFDFKYVVDAIVGLLPFVKTTLLITFLSIMFGSLLGLLIAGGKLSNKKLHRKLAATYLTAIRCTPSIVLLFLIYYLLPALAGLVGIDISNTSKIFFIIITFTLQFAASMGEIMRSSYEAVNTGQYEAAICVGLTKFQSFTRIVFPQAFLIAIPNIGNAVIGIIKEGALAYTIGFIDIMGQASLIISNNYNAHALETYVGLSLIYWSLSIIIIGIFSLIEKQLGKGKVLINN